MDSEPMEQDAPESQSLIFTDDTEALIPDKNSILASDTEALIPGDPILASDTEALISEKSDPILGQDTEALIKGDSISEDDTEALEKERSIADRNEESSNINGSTREVISEETDNDKQEPVIETSKEEKLYRFPLGRVKNIMKCDPELRMTSQDTVFLITKAAELFIESLARECYHYTAASNKKTISKNDLDNAIDNAAPLAFLDGAMDD